MNECILRFNGALQHGSAIDAWLVLAMRLSPTRTDVVNVGFFEDTFLRDPVRLFVGFGERMRKEHRRIACNSAALTSLIHTRLG